MITTHTPVDHSLCGTCPALNGSQYTLFIRISWQHAPLVPAPMTALTTTASTVSTAAAAAASQQSLLPVDY